MHRYVSVVAPATAGANHVDGQLIVRFHDAAGNRSAAHAGGGAVVVVDRIQALNADEVLVRDERSALRRYRHDGAVAGAELDVIAPRLHDDRPSSRRPA